MKAHLLALAAVLGVATWVYGPALSTTDILFAYDPAQNGLPVLEVLREGILGYGRIPHWSGRIFSGVPFLGNPQNPVFYPPLLLALPLLGSVGAINTLGFAHVLLAALGFYLLAWRVLRDAPSAAVACVALLVPGFAKMLFLVNSNYGWAFAWLPWVVLAFLGCLRGERRLESSLGLALALAAMGHTGGLFVILYGALLVVILAAGAPLVVGGRAWLRSLPSLALAAGLAFGLLGVRFFPFLSWVAESSRASSFDLEGSRGGTLGAGDLWRRIGFAQAGLVLLALPLLRRGRRRAAVASVLGVFGVGVLLATGTLYELAWRVVPLFDRQKNADRAWTLALPALALLAGFGVRSLRARLAHGDRAPRLFRRLVAVIAGGLLAGELSSVHTRHDFLAMVPLRDRLERNEVLSWVAAQPRPFRIHAREVLNFLKSSGGGRESGQTVMTSQAVTVPLGIDSAEGYEGSVWNRDYHHFWGKAVAPPYGTGRFEKLFGILNVRYVTSSQRYGAAIPAAPRLHEIHPPGGGREAFAEDPLAHPWWADGPYLYENEACLPRAFVPSRAVFLAGSTREVFDTMIVLCAEDAFDPAEAALVALPEDALARQWDAVASAADALVFCGGSTGGIAPADLADRLRTFRGGGGEVFALGPGGPGGDRDALLAFLGRREGDSRDPAPRDPDPHEDRAVPRPLQRTHDDPDTITVAWPEEAWPEEVRPQEVWPEVAWPEEEPRRASGSSASRAAARSSVILLSETAALHAGWTARQAGRDLPILRADGVITAVIADPAAGPVTLTYEAPGYRTGLRWTLASLAAVGVLGALVRGRRGRGKASRSTRPGQAGALRS